MGKGIIDLRKKRAGLSRSRPARSRFAMPAKRRSTLRVRRRKKQALLFIAICALLGALAGGLSALSYHKRFALEDIAIIGAHDVSGRAVLRSVESGLFDGSRPFFARNNVFLLPKDELRTSLLAQFPGIKSVSIERESLLAQAISVRIEERVAAGMWCSDAEGCFLMDDAGFIFARATTTSEQKLVFRGSLPSASPPIGQIFLEDKIARIFEFAERLKAQGNEPRDVVVEDERDYSVYLRAGFRLKASFKADPAMLVRNLELILDSAPLRGKEAALEYIDLRFGNRVYYKLKGQTAVQIEG